MDTRLYEGMFIIRPESTDEDARNKVLDDIRIEIEKVNGKIVTIHPMGKREFAYPIHRFRDGFYYLIYFEIPPQSLHRIIDRFKINTSILRELILKTDAVPTEFPQERVYTKRDEEQDEETEETTVASEEEAVEEEEE